jgi:hypothetical protein
MSEPISRRDFIKKASKDAAKEVVETGAKIVPGGQIAKRFLEGAGGGDAEGKIVEPPKKHWWDRFVVHKRDTGSGE